MSKPKRSWFKVAKAARNEKTGNAVGRVEIYSDIGSYGVSASAFDQQLKALGKVGELDIRISSNGGDVSQGFAIYNMLAAHPAVKTVTINGLAASMASVIAMVGNKVIMPKNSMLMIHNPWGGVTGESDQIISFGEALAKMGDQIVGAYTDRTGLKKGQVVRMMAKETWLDAKEAKSMGFVDQVIAPVDMAARFDTSNFNRTPNGFGVFTKGAAVMAGKNEKREFDFDSNDDDGDIRASVREQLLAQAKEIRSLVAISGLPAAFADSLIEKDVSLSDAIAKIQAKKEGSDDDEDEDEDGDNGKKDKKGGKNASSRHDGMNARRQPVGGARKSSDDGVIDYDKIYAKFNGKAA